MRICLVYLRIVKKSDPTYPVAKDYGQSTERFIRTYEEFRPRIDHDLLVVNCGAYKPDGIFNEIASHQVTAISRGYDNGTYQEVNQILLTFDLVMAMNTHVYFWRHGWLESFVNAARIHGPGVYGPSASFEINPHLRSPCLVYHPQVLAEYPLRVSTRGDCCLFEHGPDNFSIWAERKGYPSMMVTTSGECLTRAGWRKPDNIFRRGDQSNVLIWDRHTEIYAQSPEREKLLLGKHADGLPGNLT